MIYFTSSFVLKGSRQRSVFGPPFIMICYTCLLSEGFWHVGAYFKFRIQHGLSVLFPSFDVFEVRDVTVLLNGFTSPQIRSCNFWRQVHYQLWAKHQLQFIVIDTNTGQCGKWSRCRPGESRKGCGWIRDEISASQNEFGRDEWITY